MSENVQLVFYIFMAIALIMFMINSIFLISKGFCDKKRNLLVLGLSFLFITLTYLVVAVELNWSLINTTRVSAYVLMVFFINETYYKNRRSPKNLILVLCVIIYVVQMVLSVSIYELGLITQSVITQTVSNILDMILNSSVFLWFGLASHNALQNLKNKEIEPWIKLRLRLVAFSAFIMVFFEVPSLMRYDPSIEYADPDNLLSMIVVFIHLAILLLFVVAEGIAWMMPKWLKTYLNKESEFTFTSKEEEEITEEVILKRLREALWNEPDERSNVDD